MLLHALVYSIFLYACESCTLTELQRRIETMELRCLRRVLGILYYAHITQHISHYEDLLTTVKKRKLRWYGHITRSIGSPRLFSKKRCKDKENAADRSKKGAITSRNGQRKPRQIPRHSHTTDNYELNWCSNPSYDPKNRVMGQQEEELSWYARRCAYVTFQSYKNRL